MSAVLESPFFDVQEASAFLKVSKSTLYEWTRERRIPFRKHGDRVVFLKSQLMDWSNSKNVTAIPRFKILKTDVSIEPASVQKRRSLKIRHTTKKELDPFLKGDNWNGDNSAKY